MLSPVSYIGGKRAIAKQIISVFPEHKTYVEAFSGGAQILFNKGPSEVEVLNDLDGEIVNFFRVCQLHYEELIRYLRFMVVSREWFKLLKATNPTTLTDIQRAARYLYLLKNSFAGVVRNLNYKVNVVQPPGFNPDRLPEIIEKTHKRLARVQIEELPYEKVLKRFDRPTTLFYLDRRHCESLAARGGSGSKFRHYVHLGRSLACPSAFAGLSLLCCAYSFLAGTPRIWLAPHW